MSKLIGMPKKQSDDATELLRDMLDSAIGISGSGAREHSEDCAMRQQSGCSGYASSEEWEEAKQKP